MEGKSRAKPGGTLRDRFVVDRPAPNCIRADAQLGRDPSYKDHDRELRIRVDHLFELGDCGGQVTLFRELPFLTVEGQNSHCG